MTSHDAQRGALEAIDRILNRGGEPNAVLDAVVRVLEDLYGSAAIGPAGEVVVDAPAADRPFVERVELLISAVVAAGRP